MSDDIELIIEELKNKIFMLEQSQKDTDSYSNYLVENLDKCMSIIDLLIEINNLKNLNNELLTGEFLLKNVYDKSLMNKIVKKNIRLKKINKLKE